MELASEIADAAVCIEQHIVMMIAHPTSRVQRNVVAPRQHRQDVPNNVVRAFAWPESKRTANDSPCDEQVLLLVNGSRTHALATQQGPGRP